MFEVGKTYTFESTEGDNHLYRTGEVLAWDAPLVKIRVQSEERIINTASATFIGAQEKATSGPAFQMFFEGPNG